MKKIQDTQKSTSAIKDDTSEVVADLEHEIDEQEQIVSTQDQQNNE